jgi:hypothetical protein
MHPQQRLLDHVLGLGDAAEHSVGDREADRAQLVEQSFAFGHAAANPCRQRTGAVLNRRQLTEHRLL